MSTRLAVSTTSTPFSGSDAFAQKSAPQISLDGGRVEDSVTSQPPRIPALATADPESPRALQAEARPVASTGAGADERQAAAGQDVGQSTSLRRGAGTPPRADPLPSDFTGHSTENHLHLIPDVISPISHEDFSNAQTTLTVTAASSSITKSLAASPGEREMTPSQPSGASHADDVPRQSPFLNSVPRLPPRNSKRVADMLAKPSVEGESTGAGDMKFVSVRSAAPRPTPRTDSALVQVTSSLMPNPVQSSSSVSSEAPRKGTDALATTQKRPSQGAELSSVDKIPVGPGASSFQQPVASKLTNDVPQQYSSLHSGLGSSAEAMSEVPKTSGGPEKRRADHEGAAGTSHPTKSQVALRTPADQNSGGPTNETDVASSSSLSIGKHEHLIREKSRSKKPRTAPSQDRNPSTSDSQNLTDVPIMPKDAHAQSSSVAQRSASGSRTISNWPQPPDAHLPAVSNSPQEKPSVLSSEVRRDSLGDRPPLGIGNSPAGPGNVQPQRSGVSSSSSSLRPGPGAPSQNTRASAEQYENTGSLRTSSNHKDVRAGEVNVNRHENIRQHTSDAPAASLPDSLTSAAGSLDEIQTGVVSGNGDGHANIPTREQGQEPAMNASSAGSARRKQNMPEKQGDGSSPAPGVIAEHYAARPEIKHQGGSLGYGYVSQPEVSNWTDINGAPNSGAGATSGIRAPPDQNERGFCHSAMMVLKPIVSLVAGIVALIGSCLSLSTGG